jgi:uncharacterized protein (TIGR00251 family)
LKLSVTVKPGARIDEVSIDGTMLVVKTRAAPREGKANQAVIKLLARYFHIPPSSVRIVSGITSRNKVVEIPDQD